MIPLSSRITCGTDFVVSRQLGEGGGDPPDEVAAGGNSVWQRREDPLHFGHELGMVKYAFGIPAGNFDESMRFVLIFKGRPYSYSSRSCIKMYFQTFSISFPSKTPVFVEYAVKKSIGRLLGIIL